VAHGHEVLVQPGAGPGGLSRCRLHRGRGAHISTAPRVFAIADMIVKVKEPQAGERKMLREGQLLFTYLHLAPDPDQTRTCWPRAAPHRL
jgi:alanine dehydrogenase